MSFPSGSTLLVTLQNGASPNTGPFDLYINSISSSANLITTASVPKVQLSGSGYTFNNNVEVFSVWAKSSGSITTANVASLGNIPGVNRSISVTGSYDSSLNVSLTTASIFFDNGYGLQNAGAIPSNLNTCPSTTGVGTGSINNIFNTLVVCKLNETSSEYIKFFVNESATSDYYYHIPSSASLGQNVTSTDICIDLAGSNYQSTASNAINIYPTAAINLTLSTPFSGSAPYANWSDGLILNVNGNTVYSSSQNNLTSSIEVPGNALIAITASYLNTPEFNGYASVNVATCSLNSKITYLAEYNNTTVFNNVTTSRMTTSESIIRSTGEFYAVPGAIHNINAINEGYYVFGWLFNGAGAGFASSAAACASSTGGPIYYTLSSNISNGIVFYTNNTLTTLFNGNNLWYRITLNGGASYAVLINSSGVVTDNVAC
jgi:hypothetical protein